MSDLFSCMFPTPDLSSLTGFASSVFGAMQDYLGDYIGGSTWGQAQNSAWTLLGDFYLGQGSTDLYYGPDAPETIYMEHSSAVSGLRRGIYSDIASGLNRGLARESTMRGYLDSFFGDAGMLGDPTATQVGGFRMYWSYDAKHQQIDYNIKNTIDYRSFAYHYTDLTFGLVPGGWDRSESRYCGTMYQQFTWTEKYAPKRRR